MITPDARGDQVFERIRAGDERAFEGLFETYAPGLVRFAMSHLGTHEEAEDVVHDVFLRLWNEPALLRGARSPRTYLLTAVRNRVIDVLRRRKLEGRWMDTENVWKGTDQARIAEIPDPAANADEAELSELEVAIREAIGRLPERSRAVFLLCRDQGLSYAEAAEVLGISPVTVKSQMGRALASLRTSLAPFLMCVAVSGKLIP